MRNSATNLIHIADVITREPQVSEAVENFLLDAIEAYKTTHEGRKLELFLLALCMDKAWTGEISSSLKAEITALILTKAMKRHLKREGYFEVARLYNPNAE